MHVYVYAFVEAVAPTPTPPSGLDDAAVRTVAVGSVAAVCSDHSDPPLDASPTSLWRHEHVVEAFMDGRGVLPVRFGTVFTDERALRTELARREDALIAALARVRGKVELAVRAVWPRNPREAPGGAAVGSGGPRPGTSYLLARLDTARDERAAVAALHEPLAALADESQVAVDGDPPVLKASYLIDARAVDEFRRTVDRLTAQHDRVTLACTGPWPPFSFVGGANGADG